MSCCCSTSSSCVWRFCHTSRAAAREPGSKTKQDSTFILTCRCHEAAMYVYVCVCACCPAGWIGGIIALLVFYAITLWASLLLTECHETGGQKHPTYRSAVLHILGKAVPVCSHCSAPAQLLLLYTLDQGVREGGPTAPLCSARHAGIVTACLMQPSHNTLCTAGPGNAFVLTTFQYLNLILSSIGYTVAAGQSLR